MSDTEQPLSSDEQVYQEHRSDLAARQVYANEEPAAADNGRQGDAPCADVDEVVAESFPASDAPPNTPPGAPTKP
ncbi:hypothetical protein [Kallotenue papyrolyticum]|uniref:hypothetical protein n=1 Tax=Kallotenue papyrolyticum TaxID=1325125 RepID=UPI0004925825|nr:hypothetical protein [Kallotenue papyrolyticum]